MGWRILRAHLGKAAETEAAPNSSNTRQHRVLMVLTSGVTVMHVSLGMDWRAVTGSQEHQEVPATKPGTGPTGELVAAGDEGKVSSSVGSHCEEGTAELPGTLLGFLS